MEQTLLARAPAGRPPAPSEEIAQLRAVLRVVDEIAGTEPSATIEPDPAALDARHAAAPALVRVRYARLAARTASFSAAGVSALIGAPAGTEGSRRSAAHYLSGEMRHAIGAMLKALG